MLTPFKQTRESDDIALAPRGPRPAARAAAEAPEFAATETMLPGWSTARWVEEQEALAAAAAAAAVRRATHGPARRLRTSARSAGPPARRPGGAATGCRAWRRRCTACCRRASAACSACSSASRCRWRSSRRCCRSSIGSERTARGRSPPPRAASGDNGAMQVSSYLKLSVGVALATQNPRGEEFHGSVKVLGDVVDREEDR